MKRIAILTRRAGFNMGSTLQAYAMYKLFSNLGYSVEILNYDEYARFLAWRIKPYIINTLRHFPHIANTKFISRYFPLDKIVSQQQKFKQFEAQYLPLSKTRYKNSNELKKTIGKYDVYICGSDQIWSPMMYDPVFFLDFATTIPNTRTIAYAPSLGVIDANAISSEAKKLIKRIQFVSCREQEGAKVLSNITGHDVPVVLDPTLMLRKQDWDLVKSRQYLTDQNYILTYFLHTNQYQNNIPHKFISNLKKKTGLKVINIQMHNMGHSVNADEQIFTAGPADFISLIENASYVVTNSYHCCIFSYIYSKHFYVFEKFLKHNNSNNQNPRLHTLLNIINTQNALITNENCEINLSKNLTHEKDINNYTKLKASSMSFITQALK